MTCSEVQRVLPEMMDGAPNNELQAHLEKCPACSDLVAELELISIEAHQLVESNEPSPRVWLAIAAELRSEGLIRDPEAKPGRPVLVPTERRRWNAWWLVPVASRSVGRGQLRRMRKPATQIAEKPAVVAPANAPDLAAQSNQQKPAPQVAETKAACPYRSLAGRTLCFSSRAGGEHRGPAVPGRRLASVPRG